MIKILIGNLFHSKCQTLVNTVNCVGVMGKGIALEFKKRYPDMFVDYQKRCQDKKVELGRPYLHKPKSRKKECDFFAERNNSDDDAAFKWILNFPTKDHWRSIARLNDIIEGIKYLVAHYREWGIHSIAVPPLGCGEGQLEWRIVGPTLYRYLSKMDIPIELYAPYNTPHEELQIEFLRKGESKQDQDMPNPKWIPAGWVALVEIIRRINDEPYHWPVGKTIFQKIGYIATESGVETKLEFEEGSYGPFSHLLQKEVLVRLINNGLLKEERLGKMHCLKVGDTFEDARKAYSKEIHLWDKIINRIVALFIRLDTEQAEIVATVMFAARILRKRWNKVPTEKDVLNYVMRWKERKKPPLTIEKIAEAIRNLAVLRWIEVQASADMPLPCEEFEY